VREHGIPTHGRQSRDVRRRRTRLAGLGGHRGRRDFGSPHAVTGDGQIVHEALVPLEIRSLIILAGLVVWMLYAVYKLVGTDPGGAAEAVDPGPAD
jgi:hypothetical protein